jgi:hypothetical protein
MAATSLARTGGRPETCRDVGRAVACRMAVAGRRIRARDGREFMLVPLAEYQALVDAADAAPFAPDLLREIVDHLRQHLEADEPGVDLDEFLAAYDARHGDAG